MFLKAMCSNQKLIAWFFVFIFYIQLISPVFATIPSGKTYVNDRHSIRFTSSRTYTSSVFSNPGRYPLEEEVKSPVNTTRFAPLHTLSKPVSKPISGPGPTQPEMQSFSSVNNNNMVDLFTGDFSYNIPLLDVGGYPVNIHYNSGVTMDQEASWVGLGWNINAGTINRNMRGLPDDFNGVDKITKTLSMKDNRTIGVTGGANAELLGKTAQIKNSGDGGGTTSGRPTSLGFSLGVFHNTYNGWGTLTGINAGINSGTASKGHLSGSLGITNNSQSGLDIAPTFSYRLEKERDKEKGDNIGIGTNYNSRVGIQSVQVTMQTRQQVNMLKSLTAGMYSQGLGREGEISFATPSFTPNITIPYSSTQFTFTAKVGFEQWAYHPNFFVSGNYSNQSIAPEDQTDSLPAYGYLYYQEAGDQQKVLLDFNREKEVAFRKTTPNIAIPGYTYDIYSISGEGTGGMFRPYRGDIGMIYDHAMETKSSSGRISIDLGFGGIFHGGVDLNKVWANSKNNPWLGDNIMARYIGFRKTDSLYENVYFKNPGEKVTIDQNFYDKIGDDKLVRVQLSPVTDQNAPVVSATRNLTLFSNARPSGTLALAPNTYKTQRDKRTQLISYLTANEASIKGIGLDNKIKSYYINSFPSTRCSDNYKSINRVDELKKGHHLSEISVLNTEGRKYVYGIPVYNIEQNDVSFSVDKSGADLVKGLVSYNPIDDSTGNPNGKERYFSREKIPGYAHSFLLSAILSPDYVDITGDGITEDDNGNAVKFNYSQVYGAQNPYRWRTPFNAFKAHYNEGLKTYNRDDKGSYSYGTKEIWYMNSIESKTMIATFVLEDTIRKDSYGTIDKSGGLSFSQPLYRLKQINLYTKADFLKNGVANAKPVKSVHFEYSYELCRRMPSSAGDTGKLTLKRIWFSYNKNYKGKLNPYVFDYGGPKASFNTHSFDRWGNYKNPADNPGPAGNKLSNAEYPYVLQKNNNGWDSTKAADSVAPWTLNDIRLPSGGYMKISYESDDYAYVQNRRSMQMFSIAGLGATAAAGLSNSLYLPNESGNDYLYVYVRLTDAVSNKNEIKERYLENVSKLYFKLFVKMPDNLDANRWGSGYEQVPCFADIEDYDIKSGYGNKMIWIKLSNLNGNSPLATSAIQYLRLNLPSKAYPFSEPGDDASFRDVIGMLLSVGSNFKNMVAGFEDASKTRNWCNAIDTSKSFVRLNSADFKKLGGGLRVKKIQIFDNWTAMATQTESTYGQTYNYSTTKLVNGVTVPISSGVASYEPVLGKEENPFFNPIEYAEKMAALGPTDFVYTEEPLGESFFPSPNVGYSKVTVQTINKLKKSANGTDVTEFYTAKEFPTLFESTPLDNDSKKTYANPLGNYLKFDAKRYITISQGFKVELNDMHGKVKTQSSYAQTDLEHPISFTTNYYKVDNDNAASRHLSNKVVSADSASGVLNMNSQMGKEVDMLIDVREQTSKTISASLQLNVDYAGAFFVFPSKPKLPSFETSRFRSIAVTKIVNRYAILDSVVRFDKGSKISTANMVYDGETGDVILSRTQNEFDDLLYSFNYPAYWAYSGMEGGYKNIGASFKDVRFINGKMDYKGFNENGIKRYFESGDELIFYGLLKKGRGSDLCRNENFYDTSLFMQSETKIWAIDAGKGGSGSSGIFFIDRDGKPVTGFASLIKIVRSGKRNLQSKSIGTITSLQNPIKIVNSINRIIFDSTTNVIAANVVRYKDFWKVDSSGYRKDTAVSRWVLADSAKGVFYGQKTYSIMAQKTNGKNLLFLTGKSNNEHFEAYSNKYNGDILTLPGCINDFTQGKKTWMLFDFNEIPPQSIITSATLNLQSPDSNHPQLVTRPKVFINSVLSSNACFIYRSKGNWIEDEIKDAANNTEQKNLWDFYFYKNRGEVSSTGKIYIDSTTFGVKKYFSGYYNATTMVRDMFNNYIISKIKPSITIDMPWAGNCTNLGMSSMSFGFDGKSCGFVKKGNSPSYKSTFSRDCTPYFSINYTKGCANGLAPTYLNFPTPGYYCMGLADSFKCKPNINDTLTNPYKWGIWGNWQVDNSYAYFSSRKDSTVSATSTTNIRKDGVINAFKPYWAFTTTKLQAVEDVNRWIWTNDVDLINTKGLELQNHDQIKYNSAQYGYNQTLPVAIAQNSRSREMVFDGFEDYSYSTDTCTSCPKQRFINFIANGTIVDSISHSGVYSLRVGGNQANSITVPLVPDDDKSPAIIAKTLTSLVSDTVITGAGNGLNETSYSITWGTPCSPRIVDNINFELKDKQKLSNCVSDQWVCDISGYIQPKYSELYTFYGTGDDFLTVKVDDNQISSGTIIEKDYRNLSVPLTPIYLQAGRFYKIAVNLKNFGNPGRAILEWSSPSQPKEIVPKSQFYTTNIRPIPDTTIKITNAKLCTRLDTLRQSNVMLANFSPIDSTKILVGAWVKEKDNNPDTVSSYRNTQMQLVFNNGTTVTLKPSGNIIEGWQRIEDTLTIPLATQLTIRLQSTNSSVPVYFDDIRIHPFNSNMKSFVYDPVTLRLMAELDENNYTSFYEYDDDGTLIRIKKETEKGIKTIKETRSALLK